MQKQWQADSQRLKARKVKLVVSALLGCILIAFVMSMNTGYIRMDLGEILFTLLGQGTYEQSLALFQFRLPRMVIAMLAGIGLAVSGTILQGVARNPLADPGILGINAGAGLAVMLYISYYLNTSAVPVFMLPIMAFVGAGGTAVLIYVLALKRDEGVSPIRLILTGVAVAAGISAFMIVLTLRLDPDKFQFLSTWLAGSIWGSNWKFVMAILPWLMILIPYVYMKASVLNVMNLGDETAIGLGTRLEKERKGLLVAATALAAASVSISGGIGFIGLIAPHLTRRLVGDRHEHVIPVAALIGALLLLVADTIGRGMLQDIPAGIIVAIIGAPYFLYLLVKVNDS